ncbi:hypothetical protein B0T11DRAFT_298885 [Plectosphaerella cucumerina]|uniref:Uncharacterized protein n=1 Tax=Plectosphaerella cucumerina TaxID=40658 RepID=A0A8K0THT9_9PEZI|nr:hypothetical protein B0T11DRAFT_298885 [Plectosphaerella cucumerina]
MVLSGMFLATSSSSPSKSPISISSWPTKCSASSSRKFVNEVELRSLFDRTISWISKAAQPSSSLAVAIRMLDELRNNKFAPPSAARRNKINRSFSLSTTGGAPRPVQLAGKPGALDLQPPVMVQSWAWAASPPSVDHDELTALPSAAKKWPAVIRETRHAGFPPHVPETLVPRSGGQLGEPMLLLLVLNLTVLYIFPCLARLAPPAKLERSDLKDGA